MNIIHHHRLSQVLELHSLACYKLSAETKQHKPFAFTHILLVKPQSLVGHLLSKSLLAYLPHNGNSQWLEYHAVRTFNDMHSNVQRSCNRAYMDTSRVATSMNNITNTNESELETSQQTDHTLNTAKTSQITTACRLHGRVESRLILPTQRSHLLLRLPVSPSD